MAAQSSQQASPGAARQFRSDRPQGQPKQPEGSSGRGSGDDLKDAAKQAGEQIQESVASAADDLKQRGTSMVSEQKAKAANELSTLGAAIHSAADKLRSDDEQAVAGYAEMAAKRLDAAARYLSERDVGSMVREMERAVRRRPEVFLGALFLAGVGISRFLKASHSDEN